jgi:hypothetical protein
VVQFSFSAILRPFYREELRLRAFNNKALRKILGPKRDEVTGE